MEAVALDPAAFRTIYPGLRRFAAAVGDSDCEPDDLVQDAVVAYLRRFDGSNGADDPVAYLRSSIMSQVTDHRRRSARRPIQSTDNLPDEAVHARYPSDVRWLLDHLSPIDRGLLLLVDVEGMDTARAASAVGVSAIAARTRLSRARRRTKNRLQQGGEHA